MKRLILLSLVLAFVAMPAIGTTFVMVSDENLVLQADLIVRARIESIDPQSATAEARTEVRASVGEVLKGADPGDSIRLSIPGGRTAAGMGLKIWGAPVFREGEDVLLFLNQRRDGSYVPLHLFLGAFHEIGDVGPHRVAVRSLGEVSQITLDGSAPSPEPLRDADRFAEWIRARAVDVAVEADYRIADEDGQMRSRIADYTQLRDPDDNVPIRWFVFNPPGGKEHWRAHSTGQQGLSGGGYSQFQNALQVWNADPSTTIDYRYDGTTNNKNGLTTYDELNTVVWNDPLNEIDPFSCASGGVLAHGGPWYFTTTKQFQGNAYHETANADVVFADGLTCFFNSSPAPLKVAEEILAHELGHTLGLGHSCGDSKSPGCGSNATLNDALMRSTVHDDGRGGQLNSDDRAGIFKLYPGAAAPPAAPSNLEAVALSSSRALLLFHDNSNNETGFHVEVKQGAGAFVDVGTTSPNVTRVTVTGLGANTSYSFRVRAENAGVFSGYSNTASTTTQPSTGICIQDSDTLCLSGGRFQVEVLFRTNAAAAFAKAGRAAAGTATSGLFYFFAADNWELLLKTVNGCGLNSRHWVFYAATTNVEFIITVTDRQADQAVVYHNPLNNPAPPVQDTGAFATCP